MKALYKALDVAIKDMRQSYRSRSALFFMFVIPILVTTLFAFMFGGLAGEEGFSLPSTAVALVDLDQGEAAGGAVLNGIGSMGSLLTGLLEDENLAGLISVTRMNNAAEARAAVDSQEVGVAIIIPAGFTAALTGAGEPAAVELYSDPTLTIGPAIVESIVGQIVDGFAAANIGTGVTLSQLAEAGVAVTPELVDEVVSHYMDGAGTAAAGESLVERSDPPGQAAQSNELAGILSGIMGGMMIFFAFFTGGNMLQSILVEEERGTLGRLFTTPTTHRAIFGGKFLAALLTLTVQVIVLLVFGRLAFDIRWGEPLPLLLAGTGIVVLSAATGLFLVSLMENTRQGGVVFGGLLTMTGMVGLFSVLTGGSPNTPSALNTISLLVPQGWAVRGLEQALDGQDLADIALTLGAIALWCGVFVVVGLRRLGRRFG